MRAPSHVIHQAGASWRLHATNRPRPARPRRRRRPHFMRCRMTLSSGLSVATPFSFIHECCRIWSAVARLAGLGSSIWRTQSLASALILGHGSLVRSSLPCARGEQGGWVVGFGGV